MAWMEWRRLVCAKVERQQEQRPKSGHMPFHHLSIFMAVYIYSLLDFAIFNQQLLLGHLLWNIFFALKWDWEDSLGLFHRYWIPLWLHQHLFIWYKALSQNYLHVDSKEHDHLWKCFSLFIMQVTGTYVAAIYQLKSNYWLWKCITKEISWFLHRFLGILVLL